MPIFVLIRKPSTLPLWANNLILSASWPAPSQCSTVLSSTRLKDTTMANYIAHYMQQQHALQRGYPNDTPFIADCTLCTMLRGYHNATIQDATLCYRVFVRGTSQVHTAFMHVAHSTRCTIVPAVNKLHITSQSVNTIGSHYDIGHIKIQPVYTMVHTILGTFYVMCHTIQGTLLQEISAHTITLHSRIDPVWACSLHNTVFHAFASSNHHCQRNLKHLLSSKSLGKN